MLIDYYQGYLLIIGICALFCMLVNLYNFLFHITQGRRNRSLVKQAQKLAEILSSKNAPEMQNAAYLTQVLRRGKGLRALYEAMDILQWYTEEEIPLETVLIIRQAINERISIYKRRENPQQALLVTLSNRVGLRTEALQRFLMDCMKSTPMYLRIVAMRGCALQLDEALMLLTIERISDQGSVYSVKMITDLLTLYGGDQENLFGKMWNRFEKYSENVCCAALNVMASLKMERYAQQVFSVLQDNKMYLECRIAAIKYFGQVPYDPAEQVLADLLFIEDWEYAAVAARALSRYDCLSIGEKLLRALSSRNWHVRYNSAMTLASCRPDLIARALAHEDRYARDIMRYALDINKGGGN